MGIRMPCRKRDAYYYGDDVSELGRYAVYRKNGVDGHSAVKSKLPNAWGLYDMMGNVREWTADRYGSNYYEISPGRDPAGPSTGEYRVLRGGSFYDYRLTMCVARPATGSNPVGQY